jgi:aminopeptidase N
MQQDDNPQTISPRRWLLLLLFLILPASQTLALRRERLIDTWRPVNYNVALTFDDKLDQISAGRVEITIISLSDRLALIDLDFGDLPIDSVAVNNQPTSYDRLGERLNIKLSQAMGKGTNLTVVVMYHGKPRDGLMLTADKAGKRAVVGDNWPDRLHHWVPCFDHPSAKATVSFTVTAPARDLVVANGRLETVKNDLGTRTWSYREAEPIPPYCMIIAIGEFARLEAPGREVTPLAYYVPTTDREFAMQGFAPANPSLKFFSQTVAPYPYEKLDLVIGATRFGGMENSSAIVFPSTLFDPRRQAAVSDVFKIREGLVEVVAHEIAHQWFGDSVTEATWSDLWLSEGFADYFAGLFIQQAEGEQTFQRYMQHEAEVYFNYEKSARTPIHDSETEDLFKRLNANNYQKGAWVLHMLRSELGDEHFFRGIRAYYAGHKGATANTEDLRSAFESASGRDLKNFFARWIYGSGHPQYQLSWQWKPESKKVRLVLRQLQPEAAFPNALPIDILSANGRRRVVLQANGKETIEEVKLNEAPATITIDPENTVLKEASQTRER